MNQDLLARLNQLHEDDEFTEIVKAIMAIPVSERDYELLGHLARAYNNLGRYDEALELLLIVAEHGKEDAVWHYRIGYSYYFLRQYEQAVEAFTRAGELDPSEDLEEWLEAAREKAERSERQERRAAADRAKREHEALTGGNQKPFAGMDLSQFWEDSAYALESYVCAPPADEMIALVEKELGGYKLPASYIALMKVQNGGFPRNTCFGTEEATSWAEDHIAITSIMGIDLEKSEALGGSSGSRFMIEEWGYPDIGIVICDCPSAGHDVVMLDYRACGKNGEPSVIHVDQESDYEITYLAPDFESFIRGLRPDEDYEIPAEVTLEEDLRKVNEEPFSPLLAELCSAVREVERVDQLIRSVAARIVRKKGYFALHADEYSTLMYDVQFWLYSRVHTEPTTEDYLKQYSEMIAFAAGFGTGGYAEEFVTDWLKDRIHHGIIRSDHGKLRLAEGAEAEIIVRLKEVAGQHGQ
ncbi:SMI1/KNR4 family protein [Paenibacillus sp. HN-1]|uniref:SMI1/KNR4 family protein n=1 Tax=Paenibacillus TaxID=44249 RepID=UPI001CA872CC|nr:MULTISPECIES: SMI1/KNR4 family protein [Paenibacillus]MBY9082226.1 SMI1/KNR4 family protein [Paenibacillus sp. CGMCC 1.18879]MBY9087318.1 SMI1/KNR4 family protein [Paenibacillus sinensis]